MAELIPLRFQPGVVRDRTNYSNEGGWRDVNLVRWNESGEPESFGGWQRFSTAAMLGIPRSLFPWSTNDGARYYASGTRCKYYILRGGEPIDITPIRRTVTLGNDPFTTVAPGSTTIVVTDTAHGARMDDSVTYSGTTGPIDGIPASEFNQEHQITLIIDDNSYNIETTTAATAGSVSGGGAAVQAAYQINCGLNNTVLGDGWGTDTWGAGGWGEPSGLLTVTERLRLWHEDNFGEDLLFNVRDGGLYYKDMSLNVSERGVELSSLPGSVDAPTIARQVLVSNNDRHIVAFGANPIGSALQDKLLIRWSDTESLIDWDIASTTNTAGELDINRGSEIIRAVETQRETLVFTDISLHSFRFIGPPGIFGQQQIGENVSLIGPNAVVATGSVVYWMGKGAFFQYDGRVSVMPSPISGYIYDEILNTTQTEKIAAGVIRRSNEIIWHLPSTTDENDFYVVYNYGLDQPAWYFGRGMPRTAWKDSVFEQSILATSPDGFVYSHEVGVDDGSTTPASPLNAYAVSSDFDLADGDRFVMVRRLLPDLTFSRSTINDPSLTITLTPRNYPGGNYRAGDEETVSRIATLPVEQFTKILNTRVRGRSMQYRIESNTVGVGWRDGTPRLEVRPDGRR